MRTPFVDREAVWIHPRRLAAATVTDTVLSASPRRRHGSLPLCGRDDCWISETCCCGALKQAGHCGVCRLLAKVLVKETRLSFSRILARDPGVLETPKTVSTNLHQTWEHGVPDP